MRRIKFSFLAEAQLHGNRDHPSDAPFKHLTVRECAKHLRVSFVTLFARCRMSRVCTSVRVSMPRRLPPSRYSMVPAHYLS